jgi:para-aminobenzoate synthetase component 1
MLSYELGRKIEPKAGHDRVTQSAHFDTLPDFPLAVVQRWEACDSVKCQSAAFRADQSESYDIGTMESSIGMARYIEAVGRTKAYIRAGDIYQANIAHHLSGSFSGNARMCFEDLRKSAHPKYGSMMIFDHDGLRHAVLSISPELFVEFDPESRTIRTEPMKGTRPIGADEAELRDSTKDRAELDMITDLMRNDLGRVCELGSVRVIDPRRIESHQSGVLQASAVIEGKLVEGADFIDIVKATFPPGSVTGAPKVRAMQVIDELENRPRDSYCGAMIVLDDIGSIKGSVSIRTAHIWGEIDPDAPYSIKNGHFEYPVGAGVVADSDPDSEWAETLIKAEVLRSALGVEIL